MAYTLIGPPVSVISRVLDDQPQAWCGRLIRDETDKGVLMICDPRLISKHYGKRIWQRLPPFKRTREQGKAVKFFG